MADNTTLNTMTGGDVISTDDISGVKVQRVKVQYGVDGSATDVSSTAGMPIQGSQSAVSNTAWTSATTVNTANTISVNGFNTVSVTMSNTSTMTAGVLTFEVSPDGTNWFTVSMARIDSYTVETTYTLNTVANRAWSTSVDGFTNFRVRLSTVITGTGTATINVIPQTFAIEPIVSVGQATAANLNATVNHTQINGSAIATVVAGVQKMAPTDGSGNPLPTTTPADAFANPIAILDTASLNLNYNGSSWDKGRGVVNATNSVGTGIFAAGILAQLDDTSPTAITENQFGNVRMTALRGLHVSAKTDTLNGATSFTLNAAATTNGTSLKASAGTLYNLELFNNAAYDVFFKMYNKASAPTVGTDTIVKRIKVPAGGGVVINYNDIGLAFSTGIAYATTKLQADTDTTALVAGDLHINGSYA